MKGSEKQIKWANDIKEMFLKKLEGITLEQLQETDGVHLLRPGRNYKNLEKHFDEAINLIKENQESKFFIENRGLMQNRPAEVLCEYFGKIKNLEDKTILPENSIGVTVRVYSKNQMTYTETVKINWNSEVEQVKMDKTAINALEKAGFKRTSKTSEMFGKLGKLGDIEICYNQQAIDALIRAGVTVIYEKYAF